MNTDLEEVAASAFDLVDEALSCAEILEREGYTRKAEDLRRAARRLERDTLR